LPYIPERIDTWIFNQLVKISDKLVVVKAKITRLFVFFSALKLLTGRRSRTGHMQAGLFQEPKGQYGNK
jgi:hypothetical protein